MKSILNISEAYALALHAAARLASEGEEAHVTSHDIASELGVSEAHLSKVLQRLAKAGILRSYRGPGGGFSLSRPARELTLLELYEAVEGPLKLDNCLLGTRICGGKSCVFDKLIDDVNGQFREYLTHTTVDKVKHALDGNGGRGKSADDRGNA